MTWLECGYRNSSDRMVIARCVGPEQFFLERVVFPFELLSFSCPPDSELKIWTHGLGGPELIETLAVADLAIGAIAADPAAVDSPDGAGTAAPEPGAPGGAMGLMARGLSLSHGNGDLVQTWVTAG
ncbi:protein of unknown function [Cyanobium sp. NIES-981]|nr:protein of unknown function [Cyanobium sp. NIES-981]